jgi:mRNA interferase MazF
MKRGDVYLTVLDPTAGSEQAGTSPAIIVSRDAINSSSPAIIIVPITSRRKKSYLYPSQVALQAGEGGLAVESVALCEQVRVVDRARLRRPLGHLSAPRLSQVNESLKIALDLP